MTARFAVIKGQDEGERFEVPDNREVIIGRSSKSDIRIRDKGISRLHCQIANRGDRCTVTDMNSKNGTRVNGRLIQEETALDANDTLSLGTTIVRVEAVGRDTQETPDHKDEAIGLRDEPPYPPTDERPPYKEQADGEEGEEEEGLALDLDWHPPEEKDDEENEDAAAAEGGEEEASMLGSFDRWAGGEEAEDEDEGIQISLEPEDDEDEEDPWIGKTLGGFCVRERLGTDTLSVSYKAEQISMERTVLLRILKDAMTRNETAVERFIAAARAAGGLVHPHILQVYDAGEVEDTYYIAMEYVEGHSVAGLLNEKGAGHPLAPRTALEIGEQIARALEYAHSRDVVHGRISPSVIFVTRHGIAKLAELGFAKALVESGLEDEEERVRRPVVSQYEAPEQLSQGAAPDARTDVYGLGVVLYMMLSGRLPYAARGDGLKQRIRDGQFEPLERANPYLPEDLCAAVHKAMAQNPDERFQKAEDLRATLEQALNAQNGL